jgi:ATP-dependent helicase/nuclease subunit A
VLELTANFRSRKPIETFVNEIFARRLPAQATDEQASFAEMRVQAREREAPCSGVFWYELDDPIAKVQYLAREDSGRVATWIADRIARGERQPGDFLVLTGKTANLPDYASALEQRNVPVQVTGAGVTGQRELEELLMLLRALADPGDATLAVAALLGLFFGFDYEQLTAHALGEWRGGSEAERAWRLKQPFAFTRVLEASDSPVEQALRELHDFWRITRAEPADVAMGRIVDALALLPLAAAWDLGASRAGALLFALDAARATARAGDASLRAAIDAIETALEEKESEAPLEPEQADIVRVMNLHKAKGLEANVVVLAMPFGKFDGAIEHRVLREPDGKALGFAAVSTKDRNGKRLTLAQPLDWDQHVAIEQRFEHAERDRLLYVAATRAAEELVVGCAYNPRSQSPWLPFYEWLRVNGTALQLPAASEQRRDRLDISADEVRGRIAAVNAERIARREPSYRAAAVTARKGEVPELVEDALEPSSDPVALVDRRVRGTEWGTVVHQLIEAAEVLPDEAALRRAARRALVGLGHGAAEGRDPPELEELLGTVAAVRASPVWQRALQAPRRLLEVPFALRLEGAEYAALAGMEVAQASPVEIVDGRIDLVFGDESGWSIVDYKTDAAGTGIARDVLERYRAQVRLYAAIWERLMGQPVRERLLLFTSRSPPEVVEV